MLPKGDMCFRFRVQVGSDIVVMRVEVIGNTCGSIYLQFSSSDPQFSR